MLASQVDAAISNGFPIGGDWTQLSLDMGYRVQRAWVNRQVARGDRVVGYKIGLTSREAQASWKTDQPGLGVLLASRTHQSPASIPSAPFELSYEVELVVEPRNVIGPRDEEDAIRDNIGRVGAGIELVASRWPSGSSLSIGSWAADNGFSAGAVVGKLSAVDCLPNSITATARSRGVELRGSVPLVRALRAVQWLAAALAETGEALQPGTLVFTGAILGPHPMPLSGQDLEVGLCDLGEARIVAA